MANSSTFQLLTHKFTTQNQLIRIRLIKNHSTIHISAIIIIQLMSTRVDFPSAEDRDLSTLLFQHTTIIVCAVPCVYCDVNDERVLQVL